MIFKATRIYPIILKSSKMLLFLFSKIKMKRCSMVLAWCSKAKCPLCASNPEVFTLDLKIKQVILLKRYQIWALMTFRSVNDPDLNVGYKAHNYDLSKYIKCRNITISKCHSMTIIQYLLLYLRKKKTLGQNIY